MSQMTFSDYEYSLRKRKTKREEFLDIMNEIIPWEESRSLYRDRENDLLTVRYHCHISIFLDTKEGRTTCLKLCRRKLRS